MDYKRNIIGRFLNGFSQIGHWFFGLSNTDISMSGKVGKKSLDNNKWFQTLEILIDYTFFPIDGYGHCYSAYLADKEEDFSIGDHLWCDMVISIICVLGCLSILIPIRVIYYVIKIVKRVFFIIKAWI